MRLQHENQQLKKQQREGQSDPVVQAMLTDMQERHDNVTAENRWAATTTTLHHQTTTISPLITTTPHHGIHVPSLSFSDPPSSISGGGGGTLDTPKKMKLFKKNLKWASESDLFILRKPSSFSGLGNSFSLGRGSSNSSGDDERALTLNSGYDRSIKPRRPYSDGSAQRIVIRHIHEFKMPTSGPGSTTNEDSGCCRTSPSSCEGCEDGPGTLDSGVSGLYDCVSPMIPELSEDCTAHHLSDVILPHSNSSQPSSLLSNSSSASSSLSSNLIHHTHCCSSPSKSCSPSRRRCSGVDSSTSPSRAAKLEGAGGMRCEKTHSDSSASCAGGCVTVKGPSNTNSSPSRRVILSRSPLPLDSPTPHNSPRIPTRITATRNRSSRSSRSPSSHSSYSSMSEGEPMQPQQQVQRSSGRPSAATHAVQRSLSECTAEGKPRLSFTQKIKTCISSSSESLKNMKRSSTPEACNTRNTSGYTSDQKKSIDSKSNGSNLITCKESMSVDRIPIKKIDEVKVCKSFSGLEINPSQKQEASLSTPRSKPVSVVRGVASAIRRPTYTSDGNSNESLSSNASMYSNSVQSMVPVSPHSVLSYIDNTSGYQKQNSMNKTLSHEVNIVANNPDVKLLACSPLIKAPIEEEKQNIRRLADSASITQNNMQNSVTPMKKPATPPMPSKGSFNIETHFGMHDISDDSEPITVLKPTTKSSPVKQNNHVKFKEPLLSRGQISNKLTAETNKHDSLSSPFKRSASVRVGKNPLLKTQSDVTLQTSGTLFSHVVVPPKKFKEYKAKETVPSPKRFLNYPMLANASISPKNKSLLPSMESDTDEEVLEHRLVAGAFGAPLVSSESCTSVSHDTADTDPSATDYNTDNGSDAAYDFSHAHFKFNYDEIEGDHNRRVVMPHVSSLNSSLKLSSRRNSLTRIQEEDSKSRGANSKHSGGSSHGVSAVAVGVRSAAGKPGKLLKASSLPGVVKKKDKHKTAKMFAEGTMHVLFTMCTP